MLNKVSSNILGQELGHGTFGFRVNCKTQEFRRKLIMTHVRRLGSFWGVQNFEFQYFLGISEKMNIFGGMKILWIFLGRHHKILGVISMHFRVFS